ncbi:MAG: EamA family transporter [Bilophila wadsworthia]
MFIVPFLPFPALESLKFLAGSCTVHIAYYLCIAVAYRNVDMSFAYTIMRGTAPLLTSVFLLLSGHEMPLAGWLGILCLCAGVLTLTRDNIKNGKFNINGALAAVGTAVVIMGYTLFDGYGARASGNPISYVCWLYVINTFPINVILLLRQRKTYIPYFCNRWKHGLFGGLCSLGSYGVALWAMTKAPIAMVAALRETSVIFGMLLAVFFLGENFPRSNSLPSSSSLPVFSTCIKINSPRSYHPTGLPILPTTGRPPRSLPTNRKSLKGGRRGREGRKRSEERFLPRYSIHLSAKG